MMTKSAQIPNWQLPDGVSRGTWDYLRSSQIATDYDRYFTKSPLMKLDIVLLLNCLPGNSDCNRTILDLGCGTGRVASAMLPMGYHLVNVDLSSAMLHELESKTEPQYRSRCKNISANLVELDSHIEPRSVDFAVCLFSTLGMIRGRQHRLRFLAGVRASLKPDGRFLVHVHNRHRSWCDPGGPRWLLGSFWRGLRSKQHEFGDRVYGYRGLPSMFLHIYSRKELLADLRMAGFSDIQILPISTEGDGLLPQRRVLNNLRAGGFFAIAQ